jgi:hypothetical protein
MLLNGELDDLPEQAFYLVGNLDQVIKSRNSKIRSRYMVMNIRVLTPDSNLFNTADEIVLPGLTGQ